MICISRLGVLVFYCTLVAGFFAPPLLTERVLLPTDSLVAFSPWREHAAELGLTRPNNALSSDAVLQNVHWRRFVHESWTRGEPPLWNPAILGGQAFLATGQNQALYPLAMALMFLPVPQWYEWFLGLHLVLAMVFMHLFLRELGATRAGSMLAAVSFGLCGFLAVSTMWPQMIATAVWLPLLLWAVERAMRLAFDGARPRAILAPLLVLAVAVGQQFLGGHPEISFYNLAAAGFYALVRLVQCGRRPRWVARTLSVGGALLGAVGIGALVASVQLVPLSEVGAGNFRVGQTTYDQVRSYALPPEAVLALGLPHVFGNPTHHEIFDLTRLAWRSAGPDRQQGPSRGPTGEAAASPPAVGPADTTEWGKKNFVEGTGYVGILALLLGAVAMWLSRAPQRWPLALLAGGSLLLAFGTPLLAPLYFVVPGYSQLHTPFRWIFPWSVAIAALAGLGLTGLETNAQALARRLGTRVLGLAGLLAAALILVLILREPVVAQLDPLIRGSGRLAHAFPDGSAFLAYQWINVALLTAVLAAAGLGIALITPRLAASGRRPLSWLVAGGPGPLILVAVAAADLALFGAGFSTAGDPRVLEYVPPEIQAIRDDQGRALFPEPYRIAVFGGDVLPTNAGALFGLQDIRGYDAIIQRDYVNFLRALEPGNVDAMLEFSRIEALKDPASLRSPMLDLLGVRYVITKERLFEPGLTPIHDGPIRVYRRETALPRVLLVAEARDVDTPSEAIGLLKSGRLDPRTSVAVEGSRQDRPVGIAPIAGSPGRAEIVRYAANEVKLRVEGGGGFLVLHDVFAPGWTAYVDGRPAPVRRADGLFREVSVPPGSHEVVFAYQPTSWRIGLLLSAAGLLALLGLGAIWAGQGLLSRVAAQSALARVFKNALVPIAAGSLNKVLDLGLAIVMLRILGPVDLGRYTWAVLVVGYLDILVNFGLGVLLTRDLARDPAGTNRYLGTAVAARFALSLMALAVAALVAGPLAGPLHLTSEMRIALVLLTTGIAISNLSGLATAVFNARELMEYPAYVAILTTILKVVSGVAVLTLGFGIVGLAAVSIAVNLVSGLALIGLLVAVVGRPAPAFDPSLAGRLFGTSYPLLLNNLLNTLFFRVDGLILRPLWGDAVLGFYGAAYKFIDGLNVIPSQFVLALFPVLARSSGAAPATMIPTVELALKFLLALALPIAVGTTLLAEPLIHLIAGEAYVPHAVVALQILIWFLPFSFVNGLLQYVLIAADQQRFITKSFVLAAAFNITANLLLIPHLSYVAAAAVTIGSELVLLGPFWYAVQRYVGTVRLLPLAWRPALAAAAMGLFVMAAADWSPAMAVLGAVLVYAAALLTMGGLGHEERSILSRAWTAVR